MASDDYTANLRKSAARLAFVAMSLEDFAARVIAEALHRPPLTSAKLAAIRAQCILNLKNSHAVGASIDDEAEIFRKAIDELEEFVDSAIAKGRENGNRS